MKRALFIFSVFAALATGCNKEDDSPKVAAPSNISLSAVSASGIDLTWKDNSTNETGFLIERSEDNLNFSPVTTTSANATAYSDTNLKSETKYYYRISSVIIGAFSSYLIGDATTKAMTFEEKLLGVWKLKDILYEGVSDMENCEKDDTWEFKQNMSFAIKDNTTKCGLSTDYDLSGAYSLNSAKTQITIDGEVLDIQELTTSSLKLKYDVSYTYIFTK